MLLVGNNASGDGGGILNGGTLTLSNTSLVGSAANRGGGIANRGVLNVGNSTLFGNTAGVGGGVYQENGATWSLNNSIVAGNSAASGGSDIHGTVSSGDYNLVQNTSGATVLGSHNITGREAGLSPLGENGGPTQTLALLKSSPAINTGAPNLDGTPTDGLTDQRGTGFPRVLNGRVDIGAYETDYIDTGLPSVSITSPANRSFATRLNLISGTASDDPGGSGIARVELFFKRNSDGKYWTGSAWGTTMPIALSTTLQGGTWKKTSELPLTNTADLTKKLLDGSYLLTATAFDHGGNQKSASNFFTLDKINPAVTIMTPANQSFVTTLLTVSGTAIDNVGGSGIARLDIFLKRNLDGKYWTGTVWGTTTPVALSAGLNKTAWGITSSKLPSPTTTDIAKRLTDGTYLVTATAFDKSNNMKSIGSFFTVDRVNPAVTITSPANRSFVTSLSPVVGTAIDNAGGSGIARIDVFLKRNSDGKYWNGTAWSSATPVALPAGLNKGAWGLTASGLPSTMAVDTNKRLLAGDYTLFATAYDRANNQKSISNFFTVTIPSVSANSAPAS